MTARFASRYGLGAVVYLKASDANERGMVTAVLFENSGGAQYRVMWANKTSTYHFDFELNDQYVPDFAAEAPKVADQ